jgi:hypothetical protein
MEDMPMPALIKFFRTGSHRRKNGQIDSHLLEDLGVLRLVMEYADVR